MTDIIKWLTGPTEKDLQHQLHISECCESLRKMKIELNKVRKQELTEAQRRKARKELDELLSREATNNEFKGKDHDDIIGDSVIILTANDVYRN